MIPVVFVILVFVLITVLVVQFVLPIETSSRERLIKYILPNLATLLIIPVGVLSALLMGQQAQESSIRDNLGQVAKIARNEVKASIATIEQIRIDRPHASDPARRALENPARALATLVSMPEFLQYGDSATSAKLLGLSTRLRGNTNLITSSSVHAGRTISPSREVVLEDLELVVTLLDPSLLLR